MIESLKENKDKFEKKHKKQIAFHKCKKRNRWVFGGNRSGKTECGAVESTKAASDLISPVSGTVVEINEALEDAPGLINENAFENWIMKVEMSDAAELEGLMDAAAYETFCANEH